MSFAQLLGGLRMGCLEFFQGFVNEASFSILANESQTQIQTSPKSFGDKPNNQSQFTTRTGKDFFSTGRNNGSDNPLLLTVQPTS